MNEIAFLQMVVDARKKRVAALRQLRDTSKTCGCDRCKATVIACRAAIKKGSA